MQDASSHDTRRRERVAPNLYRRRTSTGDRFDVAFRDTDGKKRFQVLDAGTLRDAEKEARKLLARRDTGQRVAPAAVTLRGFVEAEFEPHITSLARAGRRSAQGVRLDQDHLRLYVLPALGDLRLGAITGADVAGMLRSLRGRRPRPLSESSLHHSLTVLGAVYRLAGARRIVTRSRSTTSTRRSGRAGARRSPDAASTSPSSRLVSSADEHYRPAVALLAYTGCRISEAVALQWRHLDLVDSELTVEGQLTRATRAEPARVVPRKGGAAPYTALVFPALSDALTRHLEAELGHGRGRDTDYVLSTRTGRPLSQRNLARALAAAADTAALGKVTPHDLRRSFCSLAARRGVDPVQAARMTGHSLDVFTRHYAGDYGKAHRDEARARMLAAGFGTTRDG